MHPSLLGTAAHFGATGPMVRESMRQKPIPESGGPALGALVDALDKRIESTGRSAPNVHFAEHVPDDTLAGKYDAFANHNKYSQAGAVEGGKGYYVDHNPNASRDLLAHELGHISARNTDVGAFINNTRHTPALRNAIGKAALMTVPAGLAAALIPGDGDIDESIALSALIAAPEILDEVNATRHGLGIMKDAGMRADVGQRARMAGGILSYMALPIALGGVANATANLVDEEPRSTGELQPI